MLSIFYLILSIVLATIEAMMLNTISTELSMGQILLFRSGIQIVFVIGFCKVINKNYFEFLPTKRIKEHIFRSVLTVVSWFCYYKSFKELPIGLATTLTFSSQFFVLLLAWPILKERVGPTTVKATLLGFLGVLVASGLWEFNHADINVLYGFGYAFVAAVTILTTQSLTSTEKTTTIIFYMALGVFFSSVPQAYTDWRPLSLTNTFVLIILSIVGSYASYYFVQAYRLGKPDVLAPFTYARLPIGVLAGYFVLDDPLEVPVIIGSILIIWAAIFSQEKFRKVWNWKVKSK